MNGEATVTRWRRYGKDRLYVTAADGSAVGWHDLLDDVAHPESPELADQLAAAVDDWRRVDGVPECGRSSRGCSGCTPRSGRGVSARWGRRRWRTGWQSWSPKDPRWRVLHAIPVGERGSDIDHLAIGPAGVFTINAKYHAGAKIWVGGDTFLCRCERTTSS